MVSNYGNIMSLYYKQWTEPHTLAPVMRKGYCTIHINRKKLLVHRVVAIAFIDNPYNKRCINHINGDKSDNRVENLERCTHHENTIHRYKVLWQKVSQSTKDNARINIKKAQQACCKSVTQFDIDDTIIRERVSATEAANVLCLNQSHISLYCRGARRKPVWWYKRRFNN